jgi:hypothetical protein
MYGAATRGGILTFDSIVLLPGAYYHVRFQGRNWAEPLAGAGFVVV